MSKAIKKIKEETLGVLVEAPKLNFAAEDLDAPRLNVVQAQSKIAGETGDLVIDKLYTLVKHEEECKAIPINAIKGWREDTPFGHPEMPRQVFTEEEAKELAKNSDFNVVPFAEIIFLFPKIFRLCKARLPIDDETHFSHRDDVAAVAVGARIDLVAVSL